MKRLHLILALTAIFIAIAVPTLARKHTAAPTPTPLSTGPLAYYMMLGSQIVSPPYEKPDQCQKALAEFKRRNQQPGVDTIVCAYRRP